MKKKLSVIAAFYNEKNIVINFKKLLSYLDKNIPNYEVILVDDGSNLDTRDLKRAVKRHKRAKLIRYSLNQGRGYAVTTGFKEAKGDFALYIDSDLDISPDHIKLVLDELQLSDIAVGNKFHPKSRVRTRKIRRIASFVFNFIIRVFLQSSIPDHHVGIKGFRKEVLQKLLPLVKERRWTFDVEILCLAQKKGFKIGSIPIKMTYGLDGIKLSYVRYLKELFRFILSQKGNF